MVPDGRGEVVFYNLGKFSQLISDFETIHFQSKPAEKYGSFADFLQYRAEDAYPEGWQDNQYANPDAVRIMTIHQAKGMQWPVVFVPALLRNRFPAAGVGGRNVWHLLPRDGVKGQPRFEGTIEDERRLFYVAMTRSQKFLHLTWAPIAGKNNRYASASEFWDDILASKYVKRRVPDYSRASACTAEPRAGVANVVFSFSDLKYFFECPYQFKLRILYGFNAPIHEALGYGKSLHDALAEVHARAIRGDVADACEVPRLVETHLHAPYAYPALRQQLEASAERVLRDYLSRQRQALRQDRVLGKADRDQPRRRRERRRANRSCAPDRHGRDDDRRPQVDRSSTGGGRHRDAAPRLRSRLPGPHRPAPRLRRDLRAGRAQAQAALGGRRLHRRREDQGARCGRCPADRHPADRA